MHEPGEFAITEPKAGKASLARLIAGGHQTPRSGLQITAVDSLYGCRVIYQQLG
jgi:hypothetical protein